MRLSSKLLSIIAASVVSGAASAATVSQSDTQIMLSDGQDFTFTFTGLVPSDGNGGTLTIASGISLSNPSQFSGHDLDTSGEFFEVSVEGTSFGTFSCSGLSGSTAIAGNTGGIDCEYSLPITLTGAQLDIFLADGSLTANVNFSSAVNSFSDQDEVIVSLTYEDAPIAPVPLPASGLLMFGALGGLVASRRRR